MCVITLEAFRCLLITYEDSSWRLMVNIHTLTACALSAEGGGEAWVSDSDCRGVSRKRACWFILLYHVNGVPFATVRPFLHQG